MRWPATPSATWTPSRWASTPTARRSCCATSGPGTRKSRPGRRPGRRRFRARLPGGAGQPRLACAGGALGHALSMAAGLHHPAPSALRGAGRRQPARPLHGPSAAGAGRRRHHRPHLASQRHSARQPGGRFPGGARRRPTRPECVRVASRQLGSDAARRLPQPQPGQSVRARGAGGAHAARALGPDAAAMGAAARYRDAGLPVVLVAGERYGTGSSRDWAAKASACWASAPCWR